MTSQHSRSVERKSVIRWLRAVFDELDVELRGPSRLRWVIGAPFVRLDHARGVLGCFSHVFTFAEREEVDRAFKTFARAFDAMAARQHSRHPLGSTDPAPFAAVTAVEADEAIAAARSLCQVLLETTAARGQVPTAV